MHSDERYQWTGPGPALSAMISSAPAQKAIEAQGNQPLLMLSGPMKKNEHDLSASNTISEVFQCSNQVYKLTQIHRAMWILAQPNVSRAAERSKIVICVMLLLSYTELYYSTFKVLFVICL